MESVVLLRLFYCTGSPFCSLVLQDIGKPLSEADVVPTRRVTKSELEYCGREAGI